jgi:hypothetical protein
MRRAIVGLVVAFQTGLCASGALAAWAGGNPPSNFPVRPPAVCFRAPHSKKCLKAAVKYLNEARAHLHQAAYRLPGNFISISPVLQAFVLTNLDRTYYKLPPITGFTQALDRDAMSGVRNDSDPSSTDPTFQYVTENWAGGYPNVLFAYGSWMYDDGYHSPNEDCATPHAAGCWGHRHDILWKFPKEYNITGPLAMGIAVGRDSHGQPGYAMLLGRGDSSYHPTYLYRWSDRRHWW